jgi:hypothetical protein
MGRCSYCGQPAGFLRTQHTECSARYHRAMSMMPTFFAKFLESQVPAHRFSELLRGAAQAAFVRPEELSKLAVSEIGKAIDALRAQRSPNHSEIQRLSELMDQLGPSIAEDADLNERLAKATVVADLGAGRIPDAVTVTGPLPITFAPGETVLWIFNRVEAYRLPVDDADYNPIMSDIDASQTSAPTVEQRSEGDLVITNRSVHLLLREGTHEHIPIAAISSLRTYSNGVRLTGATIAWTVLLDDPSFASTVLGSLAQLHK